MTEDIETPWNQLAPREYILNTYPSMDTILKRISLLSSAEMSYNAAASVLKPALEDAVYRAKHGLESKDEDRLKMGLNLLEEAMAAHNRYMESLK